MSTTELSLAPNELIRAAMSPDVSPEKLRELLAVRREWEADEGRKSYFSAVAEFQRDAPIIEKGDDANGKPYARMDRIWRTVRPLLGKLGLSPTWQVSEFRNEGALCHLEGTLSHRSGHSVALRFDMPVPDAITTRDGRAVQNKAQVFASAMSYAQRYATCFALGIVTGDDDDGNGGVLTTIDAKEQKEILTLVEACRGLPSWSEEREAVFWRFVGGKDLGKLPVGRLGDVLDMLKRSLGKMKS